VIQIDRKDVIWNYAATFLKIASSALLLPFILKMMPTEMVGIWSIFMTISALSVLLDFGFNPSFTRNITYVLSGVRNLKTNGFEYVASPAHSIDYSLLKGVIGAMRWFYFRAAIILLFILSTLGTYYLNKILQTYKGSQSEVYIAWALLCIISTYNLFTLYYDSLLLGAGLVKKSKQIIIIGQVVYLVIATYLIMFGYGLIAIVSAQASSVLIVRFLSYRTFFTRKIKQQLSAVIPRSRVELMNTIYPNALKIGLTSLGGFMVQKSSIVIGSLFLSLEKIASYGITIQLVSVIAGLAGIYTATYLPKIAQLRIENKIAAIKELYLKGQIVLILTYIGGGLVLVFGGYWAFAIIGSHTQLISRNLIIIALIVYFLESNHSIAGNILLSKNEVPFFKASLLSGALTVLLLLLLFQLKYSGLWVMIIAQGIAQGIYQNWKWPLVVSKELRIEFKDIKFIFLGLSLFGKRQKILQSNT
jgi:O-antigen/teichoic acid export membrane protein